MNREENRKKLHEILDIVLDCNGYEGRTTERTGNLPTAYFSFFGNVGSVDVTICKDGWYHGDNTPRTLSLSTCTDIDKAEIERLRKTVMEALRDKTLWEQGNGLD